MNSTNTINYWEAVYTNPLFIFIHFYGSLYLLQHCMGKCADWLGMYDKYIQETIMDEVSDNISSDETFNLYPNENDDIITEEYNNDIDMVVRYEKIYNLIDIIIGNYIPIKKYRDHIPTDFMSEHDINVYGTIYEWASYCESINNYDFDYFLSNMVTYIGCRDRAFKKYLNKYRKEIEEDYHHFIINLNNLNRITLFTPDYDE